MDGFKNLSEGQDVAFIQTQKCGSRLKFKAALTRPSFSTITVITLIVLDFRGTKVKLESRSWLTEQMTASFFRRIYKYLH